MTNDPIYWLKDSPATLKESPYQAHRLRRDAQSLPPPRLESPLTTLIASPTTLRESPH